MVHVVLSGWSVYVQDLCLSKSISFLHPPRDTGGLNLRDLLLEFLGKKKSTTTKKNGK